VTASRRSPAAAPRHVSHSAEDRASAADAALGVEVMLDAVLAIAG
jgi:hypothetical protein